jgi:hypothetical protein
MQWAVLELRWTPDDGFFHVEVTRVSTLEEARTIRDLLEADSLGASVELVS